MNQASFLSIALKKKLRCERFLNEMEKVVPWGKLIGIIEPQYYKMKDKPQGRKKTELELLLRIYFLQQWYNLSDPEMEDSIYDRNSFQKFLGIDILGQSVPDETTILNFRHFLEGNKLNEKMFNKVNEILNNRGLIMRSGTIVDATIVQAPISTKNNGGKRDPEMKSTNKNGKWYFGMKAHIGADPKGMVHTVTTTPANTNDLKEVDNLLHGDERAVFGDKAYASNERKKAARKKGIYWGISDRGCRHRPLKESQRRRNRKMSVIRAMVEHPFLVIKTLWGHAKTRYRGLFKNTCQLFTLFMLTNLYRVRKKLLGV